MVVMQRLHTKDLSGHLLEGVGGERWEHLCIPMEAEERKIYLFPVSKREYVREEGDLLNPAREGPAEIEEHKERLGTYGYPGQYQQRPVPEGDLWTRSLQSTTRRLPIPCTDALTGTGCSSSCATSRAAPSHQNSAVVGLRDQGQRDQFVLGVHDLARARRSLSLGARVAQTRRVSGAAPRYA